MTFLLYEGVAAQTADVVLRVSCLVCREKHQSGLQLAAV